LVTSILIHAIKSKMADGVLVTRMQAGNPLRPESFIARSEAEIIDSSGSKYCPVPVGTALREILESQGRYIFVGLPCHVHGLRKAQAADARLRERIVLCVSLVCHHTPSYLALDFMLEGLGVARDEVVRLDFRQGVWPGNMSIHLKDGSTREVPYGSNLYWGEAFMNLFPHPRCELCLDKMSVLSDMSFMDSWRIAKPGDTSGTGMVLCRTTRGDEMIKSAIESGAIVASPVPLESVDVAQEARTHFRQRASSLASAATKGIPTPIHDFDVTKSVGQAKRNRVIDRLARSVACRRRLWPMLRVYMRIRMFLRREIAR
jgi:coenzyme F420 hydrogenase subunit beta